MIDYRPFSGTCALRGCDPKKMLLAGAQIMDDIVRITSADATGWSNGG